MEIMQYSHDPLALKRGFGKGRPMLDLTGQRFHSLVAIRPYGVAGKNKTVWECKCDCGTTAYRTVAQLRTANVKTCGRWECRRQSKMVAVPGAEYGRLTVIRDMPPDKSFSMWECRCICGEVVVRRAASVLTGSTKSCGCANREPKGGGRPKVLGPGVAALHHYVNGYRTRAKAKGLDFDISDDEAQALLGQCCEYCGQPPVERYSPDCDEPFIGNGLDRVDSAKGYTLDNVVPCCTRCNRGKLDCTLDEFKEWIARVYKHMGLQ